MSFLEGDEKEGPRPSQVFGPIQIVPLGPHRTQGPVFFELSIYNGSQNTLFLAKVKDIFIFPFDIILSFDET